MGGNVNYLSESDFSPSGKKRKHAWLLWVIFLIAA